jgi:hypothetical protein
MVIVEYRSEKYNLSDFVEKHPGGKAVIEKYKGGGDITRAFDKINHSEYAKSLLENYKINTSGTEEIVKKPKIDMKFVISKLFTIEDSNNIHKILGFLSLLSFVYRYFLFFTTGSLGFTGTSFDYLTIFIHQMLSTSSLIFHVLEKRILNNPLIIYEEYRLHAIVFTSKVTFLVLFGFFHHQFFDIFYSRIVLGLSMVIIHKIVDKITDIHGTPGLTTVRFKNDGELYWTKLFYSFYQVLTLGSQLILHENISDLGFNGLIAIQSSAFLMTLKRKSLIRGRTHVLFYSLALLLSYSYSYYICGPRLFMEIAILFALRVYFNISKYPMWFLYALYRFST